MKKHWVFGVLFTVMIVLISHPVHAHFGMVIPSDQMVVQGKNSTIRLDLLFWHPFEGIGMNLAKPAKFGVIHDGKITDLMGTLIPGKTREFDTWKSEFTVKKPGIYTFFMEPRPYWESSEDCFIIHYTKVVVAAFGDDEGWDKALGLKTEIVPLSRPFGLYAGNVFQGIVKLNGKPVPYAKVEVEYYNKDDRFQAPNDYMVAQTIKADSNGVFTYAVPRSGWWGFAALNKSDKKLKHEGKDKDVELGAVIWVQFLDMMQKP